MNNYFFSIFFFFTLLSGILSAQSNFKIGASLGNGLNKGLFEIERGDFKVDATDLAWKAYASLSGKHFGLEAGYRNLGRVDVSQNSTEGFSASKGVDLFGTGTINMGPIAIFGKAGAYVGTTHNQLRNFNRDPFIDEVFTKASFTWGTGAALNIGVLHFRVEYEKIMLPNQDLGMLSFGAGLNLF